MLMNIKSMAPRTVYELQHATTGNVIVTLHVPRWEAVAYAQKFSPEYKLYEVTTTVKREELTLD